MFIRYNGKLRYKWVSNEKYMDDQNISIRVHAMHGTGVQRQIVSMKIPNNVNGEEITDFHSLTRRMGIEKIKAKLCQVF